MKRVLIFTTMCAAAVVALVMFTKPNSTPENQSAADPQSAPIATTLEVPSPSPTNDTASSEIYTNGTKRIFTASMYHNQSEEVFIESPSPNVVQVKKSGVTWQDFFETLPFSLSKDCLITGTNQTFCTNETGALKFFLNDTEEPHALEQEIMPGDTLLITYKNI